VKIGVFADVHVRRFREPDREPLRAIFLRSREAAFFWLVDRRYTPMDFDVSTEGEDVWVAEIDGEAVGFASVAAAESFVHNLFVDPAFAGRGAGAALHAVLARTYAAPLTLKCLKENERALRFYRRLGWRVEGDGTGADGDYFNLAFGP
jgi:GNAT superfamily N-acetyltransferase